MISLLVAAVVCAAPFDGPLPTRGSWGDARWVDLVRQRGGWSPIDPSLRELHKQDLIFRDDGQLAWGNEQWWEVCPLGQPTKRSAGTWEFDVCGESAQWTWIAADRARVRLPYSFSATEVVQLRDGESLENYQKAYVASLRDRAWPGLVGHYRRKGAELEVQADGGVVYNGERRGGTVTDCLRECLPDAGPAICVLTSLDRPNDPSQRDLVVWAFTRTPAGVTAWATSNEDPGYCRLAPAAQRVDAVPFLRATGKPK